MVYLLGLQILGLQYWVCNIGVIILGLYRDNGKEHGKYDTGLYLGQPDPSLRKIRNPGRLTTQFYGLKP